MSITIIGDPGSTGLTLVTKAELQTPRYYARNNYTSPGYNFLFCTDITPPQLIVSNGQSWITSEGGITVSSDPARPTDIQFLKLGNIKGIDVTPPIDDYTAASYGITANRMSAMVVAGFNTHRYFWPYETFATALATSAAALTAIVTKYVAYVKPSYDAGLRVFIAWSNTLADVDAVCTTPTLNVAWMAILTEVASQLSASYSTERVCLELWNEPPGEATSPGIYNTFNPEWYSAIRAAAPLLTVSIQPEDGYKNEILNFDLSKYDENVLFSFHPYNLGEFTHQGISNQPYLYDIPFVLDRYVGGQVKMTADMTARVNASNLDAATKTSEIARYTAVIVYLWSLTDMEDWTTLVAWITTNGYAPERFIAGEFGIVSDINYNGNPALPDVATRANWIRHLKDKITAYGFGGGIVHTALGDFNWFQETSVDVQSEVLIPELVTAFFTDVALPRGPDINVVPVPVINALTDIFPAAQVVAEIDFSDFTLLWQDIAGTVPVTASGQKIGRVKNRYGVEVWAAATDAARPTLGNIGAAYYADFVQTGTTEQMFASGFSAGTYVGAGIMFGTGTSFTAPINLMTVDSVNMIVSNASLQYRTTRNGNVSSNWSQDPNDVTINGVVDGTYVEDTPHVTGQNRTASNTNIPNGIWLGADAGDVPFTGRIYHFCLVNAVPSTTQKTQLDQYLAPKTGLDSTFKPLPAADTTLKMNAVALSGIEYNTTVQPGVSGTDYFPPYTGDHTYFKGKGFKMGRLCLDWTRLQPTIGGALDTNMMAIVDAQVTYAANAGWALCLDIHNYSAHGANGDLIGSAAVPQGSLADLIGKLAAYYESSSTVLAIDCMNEPNGLVRTTPGNYNPNRAAGTVHQLVQNQDFTAGAQDWFFDQDWNVNTLTASLGSALGFNNTSAFYAQTRTNYNNAFAEDGIPVLPNTQYTFSFYYTMQITGSISAAVYVSPNGANVVAETELVNNTAGSLTRFSVTFTTTSTQTTAMLSVRTNGAYGFFNYGNVNLTPGATLLDYLDYNYDGTVSTTNQEMQLCITAARNAGWTKDIYIEVDDSSGLQSFTTMFGINPDQWWSDPLNRTYVSFHYYQDPNHNGAYSDAWTQATRDRIMTDITPAETWFAAKGLGYVIGECGVSNDANYLQDFSTVATYWASKGRAFWWFAGGRGFGIAGSGGPLISINPSADYLTDDSKMATIVPFLTAA